MPLCSKICNICLQNQINLKHTEESAEDNIKFLTKLSSCVPELNWSKTYMICGDCLHSLNIAYDFRNLCIRSCHLLIERTDHELKYESDTTLNNHTDEPDISDDDNNKYRFIKNEEKCSNVNKNKENLDNKYLPLETQISLSNSLLNKKFKTNRLRDVNKKSAQYVSNIQLDNVNEVKCKYEEQIICFHCDEKFCDKGTLITHLNANHRCTDTVVAGVEDGHQQSSKIYRNSEKFKCSKCLRRYTTEKVLKIHLLNCNIPKPTQDDHKIIEVDIKAQLQLNVDISKHNDINKPKHKRGRKPLEKQIYQCDTCTVIFSTKYLLSRHVRNVHATEKLYSCDICGQKFASPVYLSAHKRYHSGERPHICSSCGKGFITASDLYHHEKIHANKRSYKCNKCPKAFNTSSDLHKHNICVHIDRSKWKYSCTFCNKRFPLKTNMDTHIKIHTGEKNFACHLCDRKCINKSVLLRHIETHSNVRAFCCNVCNQEYKYQKSLDIHMTKAHGIGDAKIPERIKKYFCHICPKSYYANNKLQKHIRTHTGERPFVCTSCEKKFIDKPSLNQHMKTAHSILFGILNN